MSAIPPRARLKSIHWAGRYTWLMAALVVITAGVLIQLGIYTALPTHLSVLLSFALMTPVWLGVHLDRKARIRGMLDQFSALGFIECQSDELEVDLLEALESMEPHTFPIETIRFASNGVVQDREVVLLELFTDIDNHTHTFTGCAVWVPFVLPRTRIRRRTFKDRFSKQEGLGESGFDKQRIFASENPDLISSVIREVARWFVTDKSQISSFRMGQPPGKVEQWSFSGQWIILIDQGSAYVKQHMSMARFLTTFVKEFEERWHEDDSLM